MSIDLIVVDLMIKFINGNFAPCLLLLKFTVLFMKIIGDRS